MTNDFQHETERLRAMHRNLDRAQWSLKLANSYTPWWRRQVITGRWWLLVIEVTVTLTGAMAIVEWVT